MSADAFPIRPTAILLKNFRGWLGEHELPCGPGLTLLVGENASGKSSALNAIEWCLFGDEVARKGSGIDERGDWEIRNRAARDEVKVVLKLAVKGGSATLTRSRAADARSRGADVVRLELPDNEPLEGEEVGDWLNWNNVPDSAPQPADQILGHARRRPRRLRAAMERQLSRERALLHQQHSAARRRHPSRRLARRPHPYRQWHAATGWVETLTRRRVYQQTLEKP